MGTNAPTRTVTPAAALDEHDASHYLGMSEGWLRKARQISKGPAFVRLGRTVRYRTIDLDRFMEQHLVGGAR